MPYYKDTANKIHWLDAGIDPAAVPAFPRGATQITDMEAFAILNPPPTLSEAQADQITSLTASCAATIIGGFTSSALGAAHTYPTKQTDQQNLAASVLASLLPAGQVAGWTTPFWCSDANGVWDFRPHTAAQIQQVGDEAKAFITTQQARLKTLTDQITAATTVAAVQVIVW